MTKEEFAKMLNGREYGAEKEAPEKKVESDIVAPISQQAHEIIIATEADKVKAAEFLQKIKGAMKRVRDVFAESKKKTHEAWKAVCSKEKELLTPLGEAEVIVKKRLAAYLDLVEEQRKKAEAKAAEEAARLEAEARKVVESGDVEKAAEMEIQASMKTAEVQHIPQKTAGVHSVKTWKWKVTDETKIPREYLIPNEKVLNALAKSSGGAIKISGIEFYTETSIVAKAR